MADSAVRRLNQNPYDRETTDLIRLLFMPKNGQDPNNRDAMSKVKDIFVNINTHYRLETTGPLQAADIMIYCNDARYVFQGKRDKKNRKIYYDITTNTQVLYNDQSCHDGFGDFATLAVTYNALWETKHWNEAAQKLELNYEDRPTQIQLCPWFIDFIKTKKYKLGYQVARSNIGRFVVKKAESNQGLTQIDAFSLPDKVLLHEMTHGKSAFVDSKEINGEWEDFEGTDDVSYVFRNSKHFEPSHEQH
ncbi:hypothetical protein CC80DRAFT_399507 [Byssothecium circinans]|uniref:Lysine-specific metallo-endopeptidase domain-containing protein n=1 Tax=Byssothecium circinans TaxID=147558 RepID=A0A6A5UCP9_9PLEO|nr:hypothetical protein CC80DRAFT_399507 [Byssothecium circinans]